MKRIYLLSLPILFTIIVFSVQAYSQVMTTLQPGRENRNSRHKIVAADKDVIPVEGLFDDEKERRFTLKQPEDECDRTITNRTIDDHEVNWAYSNPGDSAAIYFKAPVDLVVNAVRIRSTNWTGDILIDFWETPYDGDVIDTDVLGDDRYIGDGTSSLVSFSTPLGRHIAGPVPVTINEADSMVWKQIDIPQQPEFSKDEDFMLGFHFQISSGWGFSGENSDGRTADLFKWYPPPHTGPDDVHSGWFIREYHHQIELLVTYLGDSPPEIVELIHFWSPFSGDPMCATITDLNCSGGLSGVNEAWFHYMPYGTTTFDSIALADLDSQWCAVMPCRAIMWGFSWFYSAEDIMGNKSRTITKRYDIWCCKPTLFTIYNSSDSLDSIHDIYLDGLVDVCGTPLDFALWYDPSMDSICEPWEQIFKKVILLEGSYPSSEFSKENLTTFLEKGTPENPNCLFFSSQSYGCFNYDCNNTTFQPGDFEYDYLGLAGIGPPIIIEKYGSELTPVASDPISGKIYRYMQKNPDVKLEYNPEYELGFGGSLHNLVVNSSGVPCFYDAQTGNPCGVWVDGGHFKTCFLAFDPMGCYFLPDSISVTNVDNLIGAFLNWDEPTEGDVNQDGVLDVLDIVIVVNIILGTYNPDSLEECCADVNNDWGINILDVVEIINMILY